jgi:hypothetical protein
MFAVKFQLPKAKLAWDRLGIVAELKRALGAVTTAGLGTPLLTAPPLR